VQTVVLKVYSRAGEMGDWMVACWDALLVETSVACLVARSVGLSVGETVAWLVAVKELTLDC